MSSSQTNSVQGSSRSSEVTLGAAQCGICPIQPDETEVTSVLKVGHQHSGEEDAEETEGLWQAEAHCTSQVGSLHHGEERRAHFFNWFLFFDDRGLCF